MISSLKPSRVREAVERVSCSGRYYFTRANLMYELLRHDEGDVPKLETFERELADWEARHEALPGLIRPEALPQEAAIDEMPPDLLEYAVPRVLLFDRVESLLVFAQNGFHRKIEVGLITLGFPSHVYRLLTAQLAQGFETKFFAVHDATPAGYAFARSASRALPPGPVEFVDLGLNLPWAFRLRLPLRQGAPTRVDPEIDERHRVLLEHGRYAELAELPPARAMTWVYDRIADQAEEVGFG
ncbi:MAG: hypothetical protein R3B13_21700 [Polyangiaceae bacterium]